MPVETSQLLVQALRNNGAPDNLMPLTKSGKPSKGGYPHHPCTKWVSQNTQNYRWTLQHLWALCDEFQFRFKKDHYCYSYIEPLTKLYKMWISDGKLTDPPQCMPEQFRGDNTIESYTIYYKTCKRMDKTGKSMWIFTQRTEW